MPLPLLRTREEASDVNGNKRIALYYPLTRPSNAPGFLRGIFQYARPAKAWELCLTFGWDTERLLDWNPDGLLGHVFSAEAAELVEQLTVPVVETAFDFADLKVPRVGLDDRAIGKLAAEYFLDRGFAQFVYIGEEDRAHAIRRWEGFLARLQIAGHQPLRAPAMLDWGWQDALRPLTGKVQRWLGKLPRPAAVFVSSDGLGLRFLEVARGAGYRVPEEFAVLGVGDIDTICDLAYPPLSSIRTAAETAGFEAARLLDRLMQGEPPPAARIEFPPLGVVTRRSTDVLAVSDADLSTALRFIRDHAAEEITVEDVVAAACVSRSTLERRFRQLLGRSPLDEIYRVRVERARHLLAETDWPMSHVAKESGFHDSRRMSEVFHAHTGETPTAYRRRFCLAGASPQEKGARALSAPAETDCCACTRLGRPAQPCSPTSL
jgi:LacI family transcriptional regulator